MVFWLLLGFLFVASLLVAHLLGWRLIRRLDVEPGHIREVMPTIPVAPLQDGSAARRWRRNVRRVERRLLDHFQDGVDGAYAAQLAGELNEDRRIVAGALERMREAVDCRLRVTRAGDILHDFSADQIAALRRERRFAWPTRIWTFLVAAAANIGAIWPVLSVLFLAATSLGAMATYANPLDWGLAGFVLIGAILGFTLVVSLIIHVALTPFVDGPKLGPMKNSDHPIDDEESTSFVDGPKLGPMKNSDHPIDDEESTSDDSSSGCNPDPGIGAPDGCVADGCGVPVPDDGPGAAGCLVGLVAVALMAVVALCFATAVVWCRGLWRAIADRDESLDRISPSVWVRTANTVDRWEKWLPTNDLVGRAVRALKRTYRRRRPIDGDLAARTLARARSRDGSISALEIALREGLDLGEATEIGAELCQIVGGDIRVDESGEVGFAFSDEALYDADRHLEETWTEYVTFGDGLGSITRRSAQPSYALPVNVVGLGWGHLLALDRLAAGTWLMALSGIYVLLADVPAGFDPYLVGADSALAQFFAAEPLVWSTVLAVVALGATILAGLTRYTATVRANHGLRRDARRYAFHRIRRTLITDGDAVIVGDLAESFRHALSDDAIEPDSDEIRAEIRGVLVDLDLADAVDGLAPDLRVDLAPLRERWEQARAADFGKTDVAADADREVVFDTRREHDRVAVLA